MSSETSVSKNVGIVGCGFVASMYMSTRDQYQNLNVCAAYDTNKNRLDKFCNFYKVMPTSSLDELLQRVDLIVNLTTPESHYSVSKRALESGIGVYSEKPLTVSDEQAESLARVALKNGVNLVCAPCIHYSPMAETVKHHIDQGLLGKVYLVYAEMDNDQVHAKAYENWVSEVGVKWPAKNEFESGATLEHAGYSLSLLNKWFGRAQMKSVFQHQCIEDKIIPLHKQTADFSCAMLEYSNGVIARLTCSVVAPKDHSIKIIGEKGVLTVENIWFFNSPVTWQNYFTLRSKTRLNPIKRKLKTIKDGFPVGVKTDAAQMDFMRGIDHLARNMKPDEADLDSMVHMNSIVLKMNGDSIEEKQYPWIICGTGLMSTRISECLIRNGYPVQAVYSSTTGRAESLSSGFGIETFYTDLNEIPTVSTKTIAYVASVNTDHFHQVEALLNKGYDVLCEKPLTMDPLQCDALYELAQEKELVLQENLWSLFVPGASIVLERSKKCKKVEMSFCAPIPYSDEKRQWRIGEGGCLHDLGIYPLAWSVYLFGLVTKFDVEHFKIEYGVVSEIQITTEHKNGKKVLIKAGFHSEEHHIKLDDQFYTPIYAPEYQSKITDLKARKVRQKFQPPNFPAKDPYAYVLDAMNSSSLDNSNSSFPPSSSRHVAQLLSSIELKCLENKDAPIIDNE